jgi:predicted amidohydrolase YtcJ
MILLSRRLLPRLGRWLGSCASGLALLNWTLSGAEADLILHHGKVVTVDSAFSIHEALAVKDGRIFKVGTDEAVLADKGPNTELVDLAGRMVMPGLIDSHAHPAQACLTEWDHPIPAMECIQDVLDYIQARAQALPEGQWIEVHQVFITRLREQRYPTRAELDRVVPRHPVLFATGPDASLNTLALKLSGIDRNFKVTDGGSGFAEEDPKTGEPTGILRNCTRYVKVKSAERQPTREEKVRRLRDLFADYNAVGLTSVCERDAGRSDIEIYSQWRAGQPRNLRVSLSHHIDSIGPLDEVLANIRRVSQHPLFKGRDDWLRIIGIKTYLDGGMLTGSAYMRQPWGKSEIYGITDPNYRGVLFIAQERLVPMVRVAAESGLQFTAHSVGDGAVHALLAAYAEVDKEMPVRPTRPCISHSNFMSREAVEQAARLGVMLDIQPVWLYLDAHTLAKQFGYDRLRYFQPLRSVFEAGAIAGGGSDHMQKIGSLRSVNPYNPFLGMATAITRRARQYEQPLHPEEALSRQQAIRFYTINNARILACEDKLGSLEPGKLADLIVLDTDLLTCPEEKIASTQVLRTYVGGKLVYKRAVGAKQ